MISIRVDHRLYVLTIVSAVICMLALAHAQITCGYKVHELAPEYGCAHTFSAPVSQALPVHDGHAVLAVWLLAGLELLCLLLALDGFSAASWRLPVTAPVEKVLWTRPIIAGVHVLAALMLNRRRFDFNAGGGKNGTAAAKKSKERQLAAATNNTTNNNHKQQQQLQGVGGGNRGAGIGLSTLSPRRVGMSPVPALSSAPPSVPLAPPVTQLDDDHLAYESSAAPSSKSSGYSEPVILFVCAQLYGEDADEMKKLLLSYQNVVSEADGRLQNVTLEFHVVFDGITERTFFKPAVRALDTALEALDADPGQRRPLSERAVNVHTSYGWLGKIEHLFGSRFPLFVHYKDIDLNRNRKRWCQVLYIAILLDRLRTLNLRPDEDNATGDKGCESSTDSNDTGNGTGGTVRAIEPATLSSSHRLAAPLDFYPPGDPDACSKAQSRVFVMMTDGDISFDCMGVKLLLDSLLRDERVGGAAGCVHPTGSLNPVVFFQQFEYALAHW
jgi:hypothetical protein